MNLNATGLPRLLALLALLLPISPAAAEELPLAAVINPREAQHESAPPGLDQSAKKQPLRVAGREFAGGVGTQVDTVIAVNLRGAMHFSALAGVDDVYQGTETVAFTVIADGQSLWHAELKRGQAVVPIEIDLRGKQQLLLVTEDVGNAATEACADWVEAKLSFEGEKPQSSAAPQAVEEAVTLTPKPPAAPRINGARVFGVRPNNPFLFQIPATGDRPMKFAADGLPAGLSLDTTTGRLTGTIVHSGTYPVVLRATNARGISEGKLRIEVGELIALTPPMGWNSWNSWATAVDQEKVLASARAMAASGLVNHGWTYVNIDDSWQGARTGPGHALMSNGKFPDMKKLADAIHALGLKVGIYSTPMVTSYANFAGGSAQNPEGAWIRPAQHRIDRSIGKYCFADVDAKQWAKWGFDYLKYDWKPNEVPETSDMARALRASGRDILYSLSNSAPFKNAAALSQLANCWRTTGDIEDTWGSMSGNGFRQERWRKFAGPGHWNDPDMLVVGQVGWGPKLHPSRLTPNEQYTHISLWCLLSAPLLIGCPLERADDFTLSLLTNDEVLAVDQDELGKQAVQAVVDGRRQIWVKELADGSRAVGLFNLSQKAQGISVAWAQLGLKGPQNVRDLWRQANLGMTAREFTATVPRHGVVLVRVWPSKAP